MGKRNDMSYAEPSSEFNKLSGYEAMVVASQTYRKKRAKKENRSNRRSEETLGSITVRKLNFEKRRESRKKSWRSIR